MDEDFQIRQMNGVDPPTMAAAFDRIGYFKPVALFVRYLAEQKTGVRNCLIATVDNRFAGYLTIIWSPTYPGFIDMKIPEISDLNVLPVFRGKGIASRLLDRAEAVIASRTDVVGIGVGLHPGYNDAQRLYGKRGYVLDGLGIAYKDRYCREGEHVVLDDDLILHMTKRVRPLQSQIG